MLMAAERQAVIDYCRKMADIGLTSGTSGNISLFNRDEQFMAISPSSMDYREMTLADVVIMDLDAKVVDGKRRPSTEHGMHLACYQQRSDIGAVVHNHSPAATTVAVLGWDLPAVHYMIGYSGGATIRCAPYHLFGTPELANAAVAYLGNGYGCLLANHGVLAAGPNIGHAFALAEQIEFCADIYLRARNAGIPKILSDAQVADVIAHFSNYNAQK